MQPDTIQITKAQTRKTALSIMGVWPLRLVLCLSLIIALANTACSVDDPEDENGTIGTGVLLQGTVNDTLLASGTVVDVVSSDGKRQEIVINADKEFGTTSLPGTAPWMLRVQVNANRALFGIAYSNGTRNINAFSDASLRRWFAQESLAIENNFDSPEPPAQLPTEPEYDASVTSIAELISLVLTSYDVTGDEVINARYANNDPLDQFLKRNTVVLETGKITFQVTDPATNIQAEIGSPIKLSSDFIDDGTPPSIPDSVRALSGGMNDIVLIWEPSTDDIAVAAYEVYRGDTLLGVTPYPQYIDENLINNQSYSYSIVARDSAGNTSNSSLPVIGTPANTAGTSPFSTPSQLVEDSATSSTIRFSWTPPNDANVAGYNVYRGVKDAPLTLLQRVSVPRATDTAVAVNSTYCYQVAALNAAGVESSNRSGVLCIEARNGELIDASLVGLPGVPTGLPDDQWNVPDLSLLDCSSVLTTEDIPLGLTKNITTGCYSVPQTLVVRSGATLQLREGVVLKFGDAADLYVEPEGTLTVLGTLDKPVVLTGTNNVRGSWGGVRFAGSRSDFNLLRGAVIQYGGGGESRGAVTSVVSGEFSGPSFRMEDTLVRFNERTALNLLVRNTLINSFEGNLIYKNEYAGFVVASTVNVFEGSSQFIDNDINILTLPRVYYNGIDIVIPDLDIPIRWSGVTIENGSLTINPGVDMILDVGAVLDVDGPVTIVGDAERPINLIGRQNTSVGNGWGGLRLHGLGDKVINYANITYGGNTGPDSGAIEIDCDDNNRSLVQIDNTNITESASWGIFVKGNGCETIISDTVTYWKNAGGNSNVP